MHNKKIQVKYNSQIHITASYNEKMPS